MEGGVYRRTRNTLEYEYSSKGMGGQEMKKSRSKIRRKAERKKKEPGRPLALYPALKKYHRRSSEGWRSSFFTVPYLVLTVRRSNSQSVRVFCLRWLFSSMVVIFSSVSDTQTNSSLQSLQAVRYNAYYLCEPAWARRSSRDSAMRGSTSPLPLLRGSSPLDQDRHSIL